MDPFRDDHAAVRIRIEELEHELADARAERVRVAEPHEAVKRAMAAMDEGDAARAEEIEALETKLRLVRDEIERVRAELAKVRQGMKDRRR